MGIDTKGKGLDGILQQHRSEMGAELSRGDERIAVTPDGVSYSAGNVVLRGDEALVMCAEGHQLFRFDDGGRVVASLFVDGAGDLTERGLDDPLSRQNLRAVEEAMGRSAVAFMMLDDFEVTGLF